MTGSLPKPVKIGRFNILVADYIWAFFLIGLINFFSFSRGRQPAKKKKLQSIRDTDKLIKI